MNVEEIKIGLEKTPKLSPTGGLIEDINVTTENFLKIFRLDEHFNNVRFNELREYPEKIVDGKRVQWIEYDDAEARTYIEATYKIFSKQKEADAFQTFIKERSYNPLQEMISSFEWDRKKRCEGFFIKWMGADDTPYNREVSRLIFAGAINRAFDIGCKFDTVAVLISGQGGGKSTLCQWLALDLDFYTSLKSFNGLEAMESLRGKFIVEIEELVATIANEKQGSHTEEQAKAFLSTNSDYYRPRYERIARDIPRGCIFIGTTNREEFLTDKTGNRRWYPLRCMNKNACNLYEHETECKEDIKQCYAEMYQAYKNNEPLAIPMADINLLDIIKTEQRDAEVDDWREGVIEEYLKDKDRVCAWEVYEKALHPGTKDRPTRKESGEIGQIIRKYGFERGGAYRFPYYDSPQKSYIRINSK